MEAKQHKQGDIFQDGPNTNNVDPALEGFPTLVRWYIDVREWEANGLDLPLLESLRPAEQQAVKRYHFAADRRMSLASNLLKYFYVHHACGVPWKDIIISRTEMPQNRPYYASKTSTKVEFNVSHQASLTILAGTIAPSKELIQKQSTKTTTSSTSTTPIPHEGEDFPQLGIDITCINERRSKNPTTLHEFTEFVSIFSEVFSPTELSTMTSPKQVLRQARSLGYANSVVPERTNPDGSEFHSTESIISFGLRLFYSYWALKEAYLKMTGEALLAPWVKTLEFKNVFPPEPISSVANANANASLDLNQWGPIYPHVVVTRDGAELGNVRLQLQAFETDFIIATAALGPPVGPIPASSQNGTLRHLRGLNGTDGSGAQGGLEDIALSSKRVVGDLDPWSGGLRVITDPWLPAQEVDVEVDMRACAEGRCVHGSGSVSGQ
jgi:4'-phosphopantetheinyl transferase